MNVLMAMTVVLALMAAFWIVRRRPLEVATTEPTAKPVATPRRVVYPSRANRTDVTLWVLRASPACQMTQQHFDGHRYATLDAPPLPMFGCSLSNCACHYEAANNARRSERRLPKQRRDSIRFESRPDRRKGGNRREASVWTRDPARV